MTSLLWGSGIRRETFRRGKPGVIERFKTRPWPVDPVAYRIDQPYSTTFRVDDNVRELCVLFGFMLALVGLYLIVDKLVLALL